MNMGCKFPEHHGGGGGGVVSDGAWWPLVGCVVLVALLSTVIGVIIHILAIAMTFIGIAAVAVGAGRVWWWLGHREQRQLRMQYRPQMAPPPRWQRPRVEQQQPAAVSGPHLHFHTAEAVEAFRRAVEGR
jgi:hypothetical protein